MKLYNFLAIGCLTLATAFNNVKASDASSSSDPYRDFAAAGFKIKLLKEVSETPYLSSGSIAELQKHFGRDENIGVIVEHPFADGKTILNYAPPRPTVGTTSQFVPFDTIVMSRYASGQLPRILIDKWIPQGFSSHVFLSLEGRIVFWVDPLRCKGQMAGKDWNHRALEILAETDLSQSLSATQCYGLAALTAFMKAQNETITHLLSHGEARGSDTEGTIDNIAEARGRLKLDNSNKQKDQISLTRSAEVETKAEAPVKNKQEEKTKSGSWCVVQ